MSMSAERKTILIVDDMELNRAILNELLYRQYKIEEAENGKIALEKIAELKDELAIVLLDVVMPVMDGFEVLKAMKEKGFLEFIPVFLVTAETSTDSVMKGYEYGVTDVITKPFNPNVIRKRIDNILELYRHRFQLENVVKAQMSRIQSQERKLKETNKSIIETLSTAIEFRDCESGAHVQRIQKITHILLCSIMQDYPIYSLTTEMVENISNMSVMHDVGKIAIPDYILTKPGRLAPDEFEIMKEHTVRGCEILKKVNFFSDAASYQYCYDICRYHHERWDGKGYPDGLCGNEIPIWVQAVSIADVYEALVSKRVYKDAYSHNRAMEMILDGECGVFNPILLETLKHVSEQLRVEISESKEQETGNLYERLMPARDDTTNQLSQQAVTLAMQTVFDWEMAKERLLFRMSNDLMFVYNAAYNIITFTHKFSECFGIGDSQANARSKMDEANFLHPDDRARWLAERKKVTIEHPTMEIDIRLEVGGNEYRWFHVELHTLWERKNPNLLVGEAGKLNVIPIDVMMTDSKRWETVYLDKLTGLYNRNGLRMMYDKLASEREAFLMAFIDIDNFQQIVDQLGEEGSDRILKLYSELLKSAFRSDDIIGRFGADGFMLMLRRLMNRELIREKFGALCRQTFPGEVGMKITLSSSAGISFYPSDADGYDTLMQNVDYALYEAKKLGKGQLCLFDEVYNHQAFLAQKEGSVSV